MKSHRVLVIDDESEQRRLFHRLFEAHGFETRNAASAYEALGIINDLSARPDLILSDIAMPGLDGVALIKLLRAATETASIPTILMTGLAIPGGLLDVAAETLEVGPVFIKGGEFRALMSHVMRLLRAPDALKRGVVIDPLKRTIRIDDLRLPNLPARRFQLLCALLHEPRTMSREELLSRVWDANDNLNIVDVTILRLRQDLKDHPYLRIETAAAGYRLVIDRSGLFAPPS